MSHYLSVRVLGSQSPQQRDERLFLRFRTGVARLVVVVHSAHVADAYRPVVHVGLRTVLTSLVVRAYALVASVNVDQQMVSGVTAVGTPFEVLRLVP